MTKNADSVRDALATLAARYGWRLAADPGRAVDPIHRVVADQVMQTIERAQIDDWPAPWIVSFEHADLHGAIGEALLRYLEPGDELDAATDVMDILVIRGVIPPPDGYEVRLGRIVES